MAIIRNDDGTFTVQAKGGKWRRCNQPEHSCKDITPHEDGYNVCGCYAKEAQGCQYREVIHRQ